MSTTATASHRWRDLALELRAPIVDTLAGSFARMWRLAAFQPRNLRAFARARPLSARDASRPTLLLAGPRCGTADYVRNSIPTYERHLG